MTLSEFATSMGLTVPQILARAVEVDPKFLCTNPGSQVLSDEAETRLRSLLQDSTDDRAAEPERKVKRHARKDDEVGLRKKRGLTHKGNRTIAALAHEYGVETEELRQLALSLGYQAAEGDGSLSMSQVSQLLLRLNDSAQVSFGDTSSATIAGVIKNAGKLRDQPQSHKIRQSPNLRRTRLEVLAKKWDSTAEVLSNICGLVRVEIFDPATPRIQNDDILTLRAALHANAVVAERWGTLADIRLSKLASHSGVSLARLRELCEGLGIGLQKRERVNPGDAVYLLVEIDATRTPRSNEAVSDVPGTETVTLNHDAPASSSLELRLDGLELIDQDFSNAALAGASFCGSDLTRANFTEANLTGADFTGAILRYAVFTRAALDKAVFTNADVRFAKFVGVTVSEEQLTGALTDGAEFEGRQRP